MRHSIIGIVVEMEDLGELRVTRTYDKELLRVFWGDGTITISHWSWVEELQTVTDREQH